MMSICGPRSLSPLASFMRASSTCIRMAFKGFFTSCATPPVIRLMAERRSAVCNWRPIWRVASGSRSRTINPAPVPDPTPVCRVSSTSIETSATSTLAFPLVSLLIGTRRLRIDLPVCAAWARSSPSEVVAGKISPRGLPIRSKRF